MQILSVKSEGHMELHRGIHRLFIASAVFLGVSLSIGSANSQWCNCKTGTVAKELATLMVVNESIETPAIRIPLEYLNPTIASLLRANYRRVQTNEPARVTKIDIYLNLRDSCTVDPKTIKDTRDTPGSSVVLLSIFASKQLHVEKLWKNSISRSYQFIDFEFGGLSRFEGSPNTHLGRNTGWKYYWFPGDVDLMPAVFQCPQPSNENSRCLAWSETRKYFAFNVVIPFESMSEWRRALMESVAILNCASAELDR